MRPWAAMDALSSASAAASGGALRTFSGEGSRVSSASVRMERVGSCMGVSFSSDGPRAGPWTVERGGAAPGVGKGGSARLLPVVAGQVHVPGHGHEQRVDEAVATVGVHRHDGRVGARSRRTAGGYVAMSRRSPQGSRKCSGGAGPQLHHSTGNGGGAAG